MNRSTPSEVASSAYPRFLAIRGWSSRPSTSFLWPEKKCSSFRTRHRNVSAASAAACSRGVMSPLSASSRRVRAPNFAAPSHIAVWTSRSPPADSLTFGSPMYGDAP